ncbi:SAM hydrolase/SAM-dependent halogenase family protein [Sedimenticola selenatireducens]|uniref:SAM-dependent chlorinase/fluorinase n=1 Tax=Sedimenticola selenatireducens TaxID=191960 RepID=A0A558DLF0_9GAMM|nr:SAM-dependent chlorinase/fluorinase [Sedimenticola selenatireducens]TVO78313.1 SAM-dependent chlorinase/fluorinase [Sedimenticola selenatireducens]TVT61850.1 MAG: SAM-dependent chlorinase/fluorinase [Sedimenticola selenatireducens]
MQITPDFIALFTDFGVGSHYVGQLKARLYGEGVTQQIIDLCADAPIYDSRASAYLLASFLEYLPKHTVIIAVVDPGVGSDRRALLTKCDGHWLIGPDNGLLAVAINYAKEVHLQTIQFKVKPKHCTFHGRDIFAPAAALLCNGQDVPGDEVDKMTVVGADWPNDLFQIIYIDHYGNAVSGVAGDTLMFSQRIKVNDIEIPHAKTFSAVEPGSCFWYVNANNLVEVAVNCGMASKQLKLAIGSEFEVI